MACQSSVVLSQGRRGFQRERGGAGEKVGEVRWETLADMKASDNGATQSIEEGPTQREARRKQIKGGTQGVGDGKGKGWVQDADETDRCQWSYC